MRGLELTQQFEVVPLDDEAFFAEHSRLITEGSGALVREMEETLREFSGVAFDSVVKKALQVPVQEVRQEQVVAFYQFATHRLFVRRVVPAILDEGGASARFITMAHEVGHVLQDQLGVGAHVPTSFEASVTWRAVIEGDATLTATLLDAKRKGLPASRAIERGRLSVATLSTQQLLEASGLSPKLLEAPPLVRELFLFPYFRGQRFVFDLWAAGGSELVMRALRQPPTRSDAIYAPERWLAGAPRLEPVGEPPRRLGLLLTRMLLTQCQRRTPRAEVFARWLEAHYVDDSFRRTGPTLGWATAWDVAPAPVDEALRREAGRLEPAEAHELEAANRALRVLTPGMVLACLGFDREDVAELAGEEAVGHVVFAPSADRQRLASALSRTPSVRDAKVSDARVEAPRLDRAFRPSGPGTWDGARWSHAKLGLSLELTGAQHVDNPAAALMAMGPGAMLLVVFADEPPTQKGDDGFVNAVLDGFLKSSKLNERGLSLGTRHAWTPLQVGAVSARETRGEFDGPLSLHGVLVPVCGGQASVHLVGLGFHASGQRLVDQWLATLSATAAPLICAEP